MELEENPLEEQGEPIYLNKAEGGVGIKFSNVTYAYDDGKRNVIDNLTFAMLRATTVEELKEILKECRERIKAIE